MPIKLQLTLWRLALGLFACFALFSLSNLVLANPNGPGEWDTVATTNQPTARHENGFVHYDGKLYLIGGRGSKPVQIYDPATSSWSTGATPPLEIHHVQAVAYNDLIYVVAGYTGTCCSNEFGLQNVYIYDPALDQWSVSHPIPATRQRGSTGVVVYNDRFYVVGGLQGGHGTPSSNTFAWFDEYDPATGNWTTLSDAPRARDHFHAGVYNDRLYVAGGRNTSQGSLGGGTLFNFTIPEIDVYDFTLGSWSTLTVTLPTARGGSTAVVLGAELIVIGGESGTQGIAHNEVEALNLDTLSWRTLDVLNRGRHGTQATLCGDNIYIAAGSGNRGGGPELTSMERFAFDLNAANACAAPPPPPQPIEGLIEAESFSDQSGIQTETTFDTGGGENIGFIDNGDWVDYAVDVQASGLYNVQFRVASGGSGGSIELYDTTDTANNSPLGTLAVANTGGWQSWTTLTMENVPLSAGEQTIRLLFVGGGGGLFNLNWIDFIRITPTNVTLGQQTAVLPDLRWAWVAFASLIGLSLGLFVVSRQKQP